MSHILRILDEKSVIILLNVIIAVISDAFERASIGSDLLFGKARIQFVAQNEALESFFRPESGLADSVGNIRGRSRRSLVIAGRLIRRVAFLLLIASAIISDLYLFGRVYAAISSIFKNEPITDSWIAIVVSLGFFLVLTMALWILLRITIRGLLGNVGSTYADQWLSDEKSCARSINDKIASVVFGLGPSRVCTASDEEGHEWKGRLDYLEKSIERMILKAKEDLEGDITALERRLNRRSTRMHAE